MLHCAIIYMATNNNTRRLAEVMNKALPPGMCIYMGRPNMECLKYADVIFWGNYDAQDTSEPVVEFYNKAKEMNKFIISYGITCRGGAKDMYAIGNWANIVMQRAETIMAEEKAKREKAEESAES